jgi:hypothetical protein
MDLREVGGRAWAGFVLRMGTRLRALVNTVMSPRVPLTS